MRRAFEPKALLHVLLYGAAMAILVGILDWIDFRHQMQRLSIELYILAIAVIFACFGAWLALRLAPRPAGSLFERNLAAIEQLGISPREFEVLELMAGGASNKAMARTLQISPNTVKTHVSRLLEKLEAGSRTEAIAKARKLAIIP